MKLYGAPMPAPNPRRVRMFLAEKGIELSETPVNLMKREHKSPEYRAKNSLGQVPTLELDDGTAISETVAICRYFEETQPEPPLFGKTPVEKAKVDMWVRRIEFILMNPVANYWRHAHPRTAALLTQFKDFGESNKRGLRQRAALARSRAGRSPVHRRRGFHRRGHLLPLLGGFRRLDRPADRCRAHQPDRVAPTRLSPAERLRLEAPFSGDPPQFGAIGDLSRLLPSSHTIARHARQNKPPSARRAPRGGGMRRKPKRTRSHAVCERFLGSLRRECLDHVLVLDAAHFQRVVAEYVRYHNAPSADPGPHGAPSRRQLRRAPSARRPTPRLSKGCLTLRGARKFSRIREVANTGGRPARARMILGTSVRDAFYAFTRTPRPWTLPRCPPNTAHELALSHDELLAEQAVLGDERRSSTEQIGGETTKEPSEISHGWSSYLDL